MTSPDDAIDLASRGRVQRVIIDTQDETITLVLRDGRPARVAWIEDQVARNDFVNELVRPGVGLRVGSDGGTAFALAEAFLWLFRLSYVLIPLALLDLVMLVRRRGRRWASVDVLWLLAVLLLGPFGPVAWFIAGRRVRRRELRTYSDLMGPTQGARREAR